MAISRLTALVQIFSTPTISWGVLCLTSSYTFDMLLFMYTLCIWTRKTCKFVRILAIQYRASSWQFSLVFRQVLADFHRIREYIKTPRLHPSHLVMLLVDDMLSFCVERAIYHFLRFLCIWRATRLCHQNIDGA